MTDIISTSASRTSTLCTQNHSAELARTPTLLPLPELPIHVRLGTMDDIPFIDDLQKKNNRSLGFMFRATLEGKIRREEVLIAEEAVDRGGQVVDRKTLIVDRGGQVVDRKTLIVDRREDSASSRSTTNDQRSTTNDQRSTTNDQRSTTNDQRSTTNDQRSMINDQRSTINDQRSTKLGYLIGNDRYFKRDELGAIFQLCVVPGKRRGLIGATLLKSLFERASYGCRLYCCWCAQDLEANHFWEAMGFIPVAFRSGARRKGKDATGKAAPRVHIFWQKRIRAGDEETPLWYPSQTGGGALNEDRLVLPIPPSVHWSQVRSVVLPGEENLNGRLLIVDRAEESVDRESLTVDRPKNAVSPRSTSNDQRSTNSSSRPKRAKQPTIQPSSSRSVVRLVMPQFGSKVKAEMSKQEKTKVEKVKQKNDPMKVKAARELRDRYMEEINRRSVLTSHGKYDVGRMIQANQVDLKRMTDGATASSVPPLDQKLLAA